MSSYSLFASVFVVQIHDCIRVIAHQRVVGGSRWARRPRQSPFSLFPLLAALAMFAVFTRNAGLSWNSVNPRFTFGAHMPISPWVSGGTC